MVRGSNSRSVCISPKLSLPVLPFIKIVKSKDRWWLDSLCVYVWNEHCLSIVPQTRITRKKDKNIKDEGACGGE